MTLDSLIPALTALFGGVLGSLITWMIAQRRMRHEIRLQAVPRFIEALEALWEVVPHVDVGSPSGVLVEEEGQVYLDRTAAETLNKAIAGFFRSRHAAYIPEPVRQAVFDARAYMMETLKDAQGERIPISRSRAKRIKDGFGWARGRIRRTLQVLKTGEVPDITPGR